MTSLISTAGDAVVIGGGYPTASTWGDSIRVADPGRPLVEYTAEPTNPLTLWKTQPSLRKVVSYVARQIGMIPWHAYKRVDDTDRQRVSGSPAERILARPSKLRTRTHLIRALVTDLMMFDQCLALYGPKDKALIRIPPALIDTRSDYLGQPYKIIIKAPEGVDDIDVTDWPKIWTDGWHPTKAGGVSPMFTLSAILDEQRKAVDWRTRQWADRPKVAGLLKRPAEAPRWSDENRERFLQAWDRFKAGAVDGSTPILEHGMEYEQFDGISPSDANDIEGRKLTDAEVASAFHIPPELVGAREATFSNVDAFRQMLYGPVLGPVITDLQDAINAGGLLDAVGAGENTYIEANREAVLAGSLLEQARYLQTVTGRPVMTAAEARARMNLPHLEGTDELIVPLNVVEGGQASPTDSGDQNALNPGHGDDTAEGIEDNQ
jgi:HK97 family phage portal protein